MKRFIALLLAVVMCLSLIACSNDNSNDQNEGSNDKGGASSDVSKAPSVKEEKEFVLCREWKEAKSGYSIVIKEDGKYTSGENEYSYTHDSEKNVVELNGTKYDIVQQYGVYMLVFNNDEYYVGAENYDAVHAIFIKNGREEIAASGTVIKIGETNRLRCGAYFTVDKLEINEEKDDFLVYLTCKNGNDEGCSEFGKVKGNWVSLHLGCPFNSSTKNGFVDSQHPTREICISFGSMRLTVDEIFAKSADSYGYLKLFFSESKDTFYIDINDFVREK